MTADWSSYFGLLQATGVGGTILASVISAYVFGREYSDGTAKNLLTLPVGRHWFAIAKLAVVRDARRLDAGARRGLDRNARPRLLGAVGFTIFIAMDHVMSLPFKVSTTTSNFMIGVTAAASAGVYLSRGYVDPGLATPVMLGVLAGSFLGEPVSWSPRTTDGFGSCFRR